jgi:hypothetical protein
MHRYGCRRCARAIGTALTNVVASLGVVGLAACQVYTPIAVSPAGVGTEVRVTLTDQGMATLAPTIGASARQMEGHITAVTDTSVTIGVTDLTRFNGVEETWKGEPVAIRRSDIATVERKQTSVARSIVLAGLIIGGTAAIAASLGSGNQTGGPSAGGGGTAK